MSILRLRKRQLRQYVIGVSNRLASTARSALHLFLVGLEVVVGINQDRELLKKQYGKAFAAKVDKMSDSQVTAILLRLKAQGKLK